MSSSNLIGADANTPAVVSAANCLRIMGHPSRLAIALLLLEGPCAVSVIESRLKLRQPNLSQHLGLLRDANLLTSQRQAKAVVYELAGGPVRELIANVARLFGGGSSESASNQNAATTPHHRAAPVSADSGGHLGNRRESEEASLFAHVLSGRTVQ